MRFPLPSVLQEIAPHPGSHQGIRLYLKREDLTDSEFGGNKYRKLIPAIESLGQLPSTRGILSFGGPFSNHLYALAAAGRRFGFPTAGVVRGATADTGNATLRFANGCGMTLHCVAKRDYDQGDQSGSVREILGAYPGYLILPEGGSTPQAVSACQAIGTEILEQVREVGEGPLYVALAAGTGGTAAGVIEGLRGYARTLVFPSTSSGVDETTISRHLASESSNLQISKSSNHQETAISRHLAPGQAPPTFQLVQGFDFGGFSNWTPELLDFVRRFRRDFGVQLDMIYNGKMLFGLFQMLEQGWFEPGSRIVAIHTGGLQGLAGFYERFGTDPAADGV